MKRFKIVLVLICTFVCSSAYGIEPELSDDEYFSSEPYCTLEREERFRATLQQKYDASQRSLITYSECVPPAEEELCGENGTIIVLGFLNNNEETPECTLLYSCCYNYLEDKVERITVGPGYSGGVEELLLGLPIDIPEAFDPGAVQYSLEEGLLDNEI